MTGFKRGRGRPRSSPAQRPAQSGREEILDAAAELFIEQGYDATSTRKIAEAVGIKQGSLYYYFSSKQEILASLLAGIVKPSLTFAARLARTGEPPHVQLYALTYFDVALLCSGRWNVGSLYTLRELYAERFEGFRRDRRSLQRAYARRIRDGARVGVFRIASVDIASTLVFTLVESVIAMRSEKLAVDGTLPDTIAVASLRLLECKDEQVAVAAFEAKRLCAPQAQASPFARSFRE